MRTRSVVALVVSLIAFIAALIVAWARTPGYLEPIDESWRDFEEVDSV